MGCSNQLQCSRRPLKLRMGSVQERRDRCRKGLVLMMVLVSRQLAVQVSNHDRRVARMQQRQQGVRLRQQQRSHKY